VRGAVLLVGSELLDGSVSDRNVAIVAAELARQGVVVARAETVPDDVGAIADAVRRLAEVSDLLVVTGGLGPTADDVTREGVAQALGVGVHTNVYIRASIEKRPAARGPPAEGATRQASFPKGTVPIRNPVGSAPGFGGEIGSCRFWVLPGVPPEVVEMIGPLVDGLPTPQSGWGWHRLVATAGLSELRAAAILDAGGFVVPARVSLGFLPGAGGVKLRLFAPRGAPATELDETEQSIRSLLGSAALPESGLPESLVAALAAERRTVATAESCTGGAIGVRITDVPGASSVYLGGIVSYSDRAKIERLGLAPELLARHGTVSEPVVRAMVEGARAAFEAWLAVAVTGIAGPSGGSPEKPVGTVWIAVSDPAGTETRRFVFPGSREMVRERTVNKALEMAYRRVRPA
jgi:nicotinamide-nucleotide amidase